MRLTGLVLGDGIRALSRKTVSADVVAGVTLAAVAVPEAMGYTKIAGMPVVTGIYTVVLPAAVFALVGSSRRLVVGADSATAAILFAALAPVAAAGSPAYVALAGMTAIVTGACLLAARVLRLGFLADFLSRTALIGFLAGIGIQVAIGQLPDMLGVHASGGVIDKVNSIARALGSINGDAVAFAVVTVVLLFAFERINKRIPGALLVLAGAITVTALAGLDQSLHVTGSVPGGLPPLGIPSIASRDWGVVVGTAVSLFVVILAQSAATARSFAAAHAEPLNENRDLVGLAFADAVAGLSGTFPVNGSPTKSAVADAAGAQTQLTQIAAAVTAGVVLLVATGLLRWLPDATLAAVVFFIGVRLVDIRKLHALWTIRRDEFALAVLTAAVVTFAGVEQGVLCAVALSLLDYVHRGYRPRDVIVVQDGAAAGQLVAHRAAPGVETSPGVIVYRFDAALFYANADHFAQRLIAMVDAAEHPVTRVILDLSPVPDIDYTAGQVMKQTLVALTKRSIVIGVAHAEDIEPLLERYGILEVIGAANVFPNLHEALGMR